MASRAEWYAIASIRGVGPARVRDLLLAYGSLDEALAQPDERLAGARLLSETQVAHLRRNLGMIDQIEAMLDDLDMDGTRLVTRDGDDYPPILRTIAAPPTILFVRGDPACAHLPGAAIVGARSATEEDLEFARTLGAAVSRAGLSVISGLAAGVDSAAHEGCLAEGGTPVGVLGCGLRAIRGQTDLCEEVARSGVLMTELEPDSPPTVANLMGRNRVVTGLAHAVVAVALGESQGTLSAMAAAKSQGRPLFLSAAAASTEAGAAHIRAGAMVLEDHRDPSALVQAARAYRPIVDGGQGRLFP